MRSVYDSICVERAVDPIAITGVGTPIASAVQTIDTFGYNSALFELAVGTCTGTATAITVDARVQECATSSGTFIDFATGTAVATQYTITGGTATAKHLQIRVEGLGAGRLRYMRLLVTLGGTPTDKVVPLAAVCLLGRAYQAPVANSSTAGA